MPSIYTVTAAIKAFEEKKKAVNECIKIQSTTQGVYNVRIIAAPIINRNIMLHELTENIKQGDDCLHVKILA